MVKGDFINGYQLTTDLKAVGQCKWGFANKNGKEYFIKEFLSPVYPRDDGPGSPKTKELNRRRCEVFDNHNRAIMNALKGKAGEGGNLIVAVDFFLFPETNRYYKITEKIDVTNIQIVDLARLPFDNQALILRTVAHSLNILHSVKIVHGDLKPDNILIKKTTTGIYTTKLIDFDSSYFSGEPPSNEDTVGDPVYYSPELGAYVEERDTYIPSMLQLKSDVFALGLIYHQYLTGKLPDWNKKEYNYLYSAVLDGFVPKIDNSLPEYLRELLQAMLQKESSKRPDIGTVFECLKIGKAPVDKKPAPLSSLFSKKSPPKPEPIPEEPIPPEALVAKKPVPLFSKKSPPKPEPIPEEPIPPEAPVAKKPVPLFSKKSPPKPEPIPEEPENNGRKETSSIIIRMGKK